MSLGKTFINRNITLTGIQPKLWSVIMMFHENIRSIDKSVSHWLIFLTEMFDFGLFGCQKNNFVTITQKRYLYRNPPPTRVNARKKIGFQSLLLQLGEQVKLLLSTAACRRG